MRMKYDLDKEDIAEAISEWIAKHHARSATKENIKIEINLGMSTTGYGMAEKEEPHLYGATVTIESK